MNRQIDSSEGIDVNASDVQVVEEVRAAWVQVLGGDDFADDEGFFEVGGNSMMVVDLHETLAARFPGSGLRLLDLFGLPTVALQASRLAATTAR